MENMNEEKNSHPMPSNEHSANNSSDMNDLSVHNQEMEEDVIKINEGEQDILSELEEDITSFDQHDANTLVDVIGKLFTEEQLLAFRNSFNLLKKRFRELLEDEKTKQYNLHIEEGGKPDAFYYEPTDPLNRLKEAIRSYSDKLTEIRKREEQALQSNFLSKQDLVHELRLLISEESDIKRAFERFNELRHKWSSIGPVPQHLAEELWKNFKFLSDKFYEFVQINKELYEIELRRNLKVKKQLVSRSEGLMKMPSIQKSIELLHTIQKEWRETGPVPREQAKPLFDSFKEIVQKVYARRDDFIKEREEERQKNLSAKTSLCEQLEAINGEKITSLSQWKAKEVVLDQIDEQWKKTGRVPIEHNDAIWERFKQARRAFYRLKQPLLKHIHDELAGNYDKKVKLCERAEALQSNTDWKKTTQEFMNLQSEWKKIGAVERKKSDAIWTRFRAACDTFFQAKEYYFAGQSDREQENLTKKNRILAEMDQFQPSDSLEDNLLQIKNFQQQWQEAGFVPFKDKSAIEAKFEAAVNSLLEKMHIDKDKRFRLEYKLKIDGILQSPQAESMLKEERTFVGNKIRKLSEEIAQLENNLGFFRHAKEGASIREEYEAKIVTLKNELIQLEERKHLIKNAFQKLGK